MTCLINILVGNPYRVLGVVANSKTENLKSSYEKQQAEINNPKYKNRYDFNLILPILVRSHKMLEEVNNVLAVKLNSLLFAMYWFVEVTDDDKEALSSIMVDNIFAARTIWKNNQSVFSHKHNLAVLSLIENYKDNYVSYVNDLKNDLNEFCKTFSVEPKEINIDKFIRLVLEILEKNPQNIESVLALIEQNHQNGTKEDSSSSTSLSASEIFWKIVKELHSKTSILQSEILKENEEETTNIQEENLSKNTVSVSATSV